MKTKKELYKLTQLNSDKLLECFDFWDFENDKIKIERLIKEINEGIRKMYAVKYNDSFIAGCSISYQSPSNLRTIPNKRAYISYVAVKFNYRGQGIGTYMLRNLFDIAHSEGFTELSILVDNINVLAKKLYVNLGFTNVLSENEMDTLLLKLL